MNPQNNRSLGQIIRDFEAAEKTSAVVLDDVPPKNRPAAAIARRDAVDALLLLKNEYRQQLGSRAATIFLRGPSKSQREFADLASVEGDTINVSAREMYERIAKDIEPTIGAQRQFGGTQLGHLLRSLEAVAKLAGASFLPTPHLNEVVTVRTFDDIVNVVRELLRAQIGDDLNKLWLEFRVAEIALGERYVDKVVPVVVTDARDEAQYLAKEMFSGRTIRFDVGTQVDKEVVLAAFKKLQEYLKSNTKQPNN